jgi:pyridoxine 5-phosphate synthase
MHRFALDIDSIALIRNLLNNSEPDPIQAVVLAELGGAESIVCYLRDDMKTVNEKDVLLLKQIVKTDFNIRSNITEKNIRTLMRIKPDMITFVSPGSISQVTPTYVDLETYDTQLQDFVIDLRSNNILSSIIVEPEISQVKLAGKLEFDYIEIDVSAIADINDQESELIFLEKLTGLVFAAGKLGLGVNVSGKINYDTVRELANIDQIEDIIVGQPVFNRALAIGIEQAVRDMITLL